MKATGSKNVGVYVLQHMVVVKTEVLRSSSLTQTTVLEGKHLRIRH